MNEHQDRKEELPDDGAQSPRWSGGSDVISQQGPQDSPFAQQGTSSSQYGAEPSHEAPNAPSFGAGTGASAYSAPASPAAGDYSAPHDAYAQAQPTGAGQPYGAVPGVSGYAGATGYANPAANAGYQGQTGASHPGYGFAAGAQYAAPSSPAEAADREAASQVHLYAGVGALLGCGWLGALIGWMTLKEKGPIADREGKAALNFQLTHIIIQIILLIASTLLMVIIIGFLGFFVMAGLWIASMVLPFLQIGKVKAGGASNYPMTWNLIS